MKHAKITKLTAEQTAMLAVVRDEWIANSLRTGRATAAERREIVEHVVGLYATAKLKAPRVVVVRSPREMAVVGGAAAWWWHCQQGSAATSAATDAATLAATRAATSDATSAATYAATDAATADATDAATYAATADATDDATDDAAYAATADATYAATDAATADATYAATDAATADATYAATDAATDAATADATDAATYAATRAATYAATAAATADATDAATDDATYAATYDATDAATNKCSQRWWNVSQGGHLWSAWCAYTDFWGRILPTTHPHTAGVFLRARHWLRLAQISGYRWMHAEFCIVSERPIRLVTEQVRDGSDHGVTHVAHCEDGPTHLWADGFAIWHWHGVRVPQHVIESPQTITLSEIRAEANAEVRRVMRERYGIARYLRDTGAKLLDTDYEGAREGAAPRALLQDDDGDRWLVGTDGSTGRVYYMAIVDDVSTCRAAHASICGFDEKRIICKS